MKSKQRLEGHLLIDHRASPGLPGSVLLGEGKTFEAAVYYCGHCQRGIIKNPERARLRSYCAKCDKYICDGCGAVMAQTLECRTFAKVIDQALESAVREPSLILRG